MERPFPVQFDGGGPPDVLEVSLEFQSAISDVGREKGIQEVMDAFGRLGARGALAGHSNNPADARMTLADTRLAAKEGYWLFQGALLDPTSICVLLNMIHYLHLEDAPVKRARIAWSGIRRLPNPMAIRFPSRWPALSFDLAIGDLLDDIDVIVRFRQPQDQATIQRVVDAMSVWLLATHRGAYADDSFDPSKTAVFLGPDVMNLSAERIIWFIEVFRCNESALDGLINLLEWVHQRVAPVTQVEVGP